MDLTLREAGHGEECLPPSLHPAPRALTPRCGWRIRVQSLASTHSDTGRVGGDADTGRVGGDTQGPPPRRARRQGHGFHRMEQVHDDHLHVPHDSLLLDFQERQVGEYSTLGESLQTWLTRQQHQPMRRSAAR